MNILKNKKFRFGAVAVIFTIAVVALVIIANVIFSSLARKYNWYFDMTSDTLFTISDESDEKIAPLGKDNNYTIYFLTDRERLTSSAASSLTISNNSYWGLKNIYSLALQLEENYDFVNVDFINLSSEPEKIKDVYGEKFASSYDMTTFYPYYVIIRNDTFMKNSDGSYIYDTATGEKTKDYFVKLYSRNDFYTGDSRGYLSGFCGDFKFTSALLSLASNSCNAYFLTGHGEGVGTGNSFGNAAYLASLYKDAGYNVKKLDLMSEDIESLNESTLIVIYGPTNDISKGEEGSRNDEYGKLKKFLEKEGNQLAVFLDPGKASLSNLEGLLSEYGIGVESAKMKDSGDASLSVDGYTLSGKYNGNRITEIIADTGSKAIFTSAKALTVDSSKGAFSVIDAPESSSPDGKVSYEEGTKVSLLAFSSKESKGSVFVCGSTGFALGANLYTSIYSNRDIVLSLMKESGKEDIPLNVRMKTLDYNKLDITKSEGIIWTVIVTVLIPIVFALIGTVVYIRRRHS